MAFTNLTSDFRFLYDKKRSQIPESKRRKLTRVPKPSSDQPSLGKEFIAEAYVVLKHITTLTRMLASIRKPYLDVHSRAPGFARSQARNIDLSGGVERAWDGVKYLTAEERDQIDVQARVILSRCANKVKEMEALESRRAELVASNANPLARLLPTRLLPPDESRMSSAAVAAHHASVTWYLSRRLAEASEAQREMQEERMRRQLERTKTLGSGAAREALAIGISEPPGMAASTSSSITSSWLGGAASSIAASIRGNDSSPQPSYPTPTDSELGSEDEDEIELSQSQILQFESENAAILQNVQDTLASVQQAESRILEISALQTELLTHLQTQTQITEQLYEDAIAATGQVEKGNVQLREAKRRAKDSRLFVLVFLIGASLSLLFLHYY
ncbi:hypothetical protein PUNSTDRAFT_132796 [Punctularia strigosozonata HHB-11173 SS5]|uniref:uncharacterized protein n=1 Tax=Punctularia strigosozonata (strain HHB-11173) TaxID=741275 RepID=UPI0004418106|nr:uncharacterized protein PUNSTDRAFT_132796 [Punctularia strigosozonata HHB-11173 SS5]EIN10722.1 hypothetical protein PUNSTDRAFT_132796 [Punctularia strigosozonata HHB-11173 SS5]